MILNKIQSTRKWIFNSLYSKLGILEKLVKLKFFSIFPGKVKRDSLENIKWLITN